MTPNPNPTPELMQITVNGAPMVVSEGATVAELIEEHFEARAGIAVAVDGELAPRSGWDQAQLRPGARVEVLTAVQGG